MVTHTWVRQSNGDYQCLRCKVTGRKVGDAWPPLRRPAYIMPEYRHCGPETAQLVVQQVLDRLTGDVWERQSLTLTDGTA